MLAPIGERTPAGDCAWREFELARPPFLARSSMRPRRLTAAACFPPATARVSSNSRTAYSNNRRNAVENIVDADPVAARVREIMADRAQWTGTASALLQAGTHVAGNPMVADLSGWPKNPRALAGRLRRAQTLLRTLGIEIVFGREGRLGTRTIRITAIGENQSHDTVSTVSLVSTASHNGHGAGVNHPPPGLEQAL